MVYRSEVMSLCHLILESDCAFNCVSELGEIGLVQFKDMNKNLNMFQRKYVNELRRCEEMDRILRYLLGEIKKHNIKIHKDESDPPSANSRVLSDYETQFESLMKEIKSINSNLELLLKNYMDLKELQYLLKKTQVFFDEVDHSYDMPLLDIDTSDQASLLEDDHQPINIHINSFRLRFIAGVITKEKLQYFERMLFRVCHNNTLLKYTDIDMPYLEHISSEDMNKCVFLVFYQGDQLKSRVTKICEGFHAKIYPCPDSQAERREMAMGVMTRLEDLNIVLNSTKDHRNRVLSGIGESICLWTTRLHKTKSIYSTLNLFNYDITQKCLIGECWCPQLEMNRIVGALHRGTLNSGCNDSAAILHKLSSSEEPPTYNKTNKLTQVYQHIIDAYSVPTYMEMNPAPFSIITFPFLFSIMFGDVGHGFILFLFGLMLVICEKRFSLSLLKQEMFSMLFAGRYLIILMGAFSIYSGLLYNDCFSRPFKVFETAWSAKRITKISTEETLDPNDKQDFNGFPYLFGLDPIWQMSSNKISFLNSFKMKISVIFGVCHMMFGIILSLFNHRFFRNHLNIVCEFIPQVIFLLFTFGYLVVLIFYKWLAYDASSSSQAPSLLIGFINMFLMTYPTAPENVAVSPARHILQVVLVLCALACIPWLLFPKPLILRKKHLATSRPTRKQKKHSRNENNEENISLLDTHENSDLLIESNLSIQSGDIERNDNNQPDGSNHNQFNFGDIFVHQCIHTIEYCLGCISHTASYLRLWALSLAHAQLSEVLWNMVLRVGFTKFTSNWALGSIAVYLTFAPWAILTLVILLAMEGLSAFLHTLRLHWIEFMSKFYKGEGYLFEPFSFKKSLEIYQNNQE